MSRNSSSGLVHVSLFEEKKKKTLKLQLQHGSKRSRNQTPNSKHSKPFATRRRPPSVCCKLFKDRQTEFPFFFNDTSKAGNRDTKAE